MKERFSLLEGSCPTCHRQSLCLAVWTDVLGNVRQQVRCTSCGYHGHTSTAPGRQAKVERFDSSKKVIVAPASRTGRSFIELLRSRGVKGVVVERLRTEDAVGKHVYFYGFVPKLSVLVRADQVTECLFGIPRRGWARDLSVRELTDVFRGFKNYQINAL